MLFPILKVCLKRCMKSKFFATDAGFHNFFPMSKSKKWDIFVNDLLKIVLINSYFLFHRILLAYLRAEPNTQDCPKDHPNCTTTL